MGLIEFRHIVGTLRSLSRDAENVLRATRIRLVAVPRDWRATSGFRNAESCRASLGYIRIGR
jgi:hypothetical protein